MEVGGNKKKISKMSAIAAAAKKQRERSECRAHVSFKSQL
jgi:hypothetical protein